MTTKLPKIAKPRPVKWGKPVLIEDGDGFFIECEHERLPDKGEHQYGWVLGPVRKTKAAAIRAWNKQEGGK